MALLFLILLLSLVRIVQMSSLLRSVKQNHPNKPKNYLKSNLYNAIVLLLLLYNNRIYK